MQCNNRLVCLQDSISLTELMSLWFQVFVCDIWVRLISGGGPWSSRANVIWPMITEIILVSGNPGTVCVCVASQAKGQTRHN